jgi:glycerophosphoryl diester phosphodiesterase
LARAGAPEAAHAHGFLVTGWQGTTPADVETLVAWGVDHVTSDNPTLARATLTGLTTGTVAAS